MTRWAAAENSRSRIRAQAGANLWGRAYKAHQAGLTLIFVMGTDELH